MEADHPDFARRAELYHPLAIDGPNPGQSRTSNPLIRPVDALLSRETQAGLAAANDDGSESGGFQAAGRLQSEISYVLSLFGGDMDNQFHGFLGNKRITAGKRDLSVHRGTRPIHHRNLSDATPRRNRL